MIGRQPVLTIAVPVKDGEERLGLCLRQIDTFVEGWGEPCELIVVDDGSTDATPEILAAFADDHAYVRVLRHEVNRGKGAALKSAVAESRGELVATIDADATYALDPLPRFIEAIRAGHDAAIANRRDWRTQFVLHPRDFVYVGFRHALGGLFSWLARSVVGLRVSDCQAGFKVFDGAVARRLFPEVEADRFGFDVEVLALLQAEGLGVAELPATYLYEHQRSTVRLAHDGAHMLKRLFRVRGMLRRRRRSGEFVDAKRADYQQLARESGHPIQRFWHAGKWPLVAKRLPLEADDRVLDAGAGSSEVAARISEKVHFTCAMDLSPEPLAVLAGSHPEGPPEFLTERRPGSGGERAFVGADLNLLPFADDSFDKIVVLEVIEHLACERAGRYLCELRRVLAPKGQLLLTTPNYRSFWPVLEWLIDRFGGAAQMGGKQHICHFDPARLRRVLGDNGFRVRREGSVYHLSPFLSPIAPGLAERVYAWEMSWGGRFGPILYAVAEKTLAAGGLAEQDDG